MMPFPVEKQHSTYCKNSGHLCRPLSGTCNVCSTACLSCLHINQHHMGSTVDECSREASSGNAISYSVNDIIPVSNSRCEHLVSGSSSNTLGNIDCEASCRNNSNLLSSTSETVSVFPKLNEFKVQDDDHKDHHQSCIAEVSDSKSLQFSTSIADGRDSSSFQFSANAPLAQENVSIGSFHTSSECLNVRSNFDDGQRNTNGQQSTSQENLKELPDVCSLTALSPQSAGLFETLSDSREHAIDRLNAEGNNLSHVAIDKFPSSDPSPEVLQEHLSPRLLSKNMNSQFGVRSSVNNHYDLSENVMEIVAKNEVGDNADLCLSNVNESSLESHSLDECDDSDLVEHDVKVCDICGDAGREDLLAICCMCIDGAEHTYCMREMLDKVPSGDWLCEECKFYVEMKGRDQEIVGIVDGSEKSNASAPTDPESVHIYKKFEIKDSDDDKNKIYHDFPTAKILGKRQADDSQEPSPAKSRALEPDNVSANKSTSNEVPAISRNSSMKLDRLKTKTNQYSSNSSIAATESANLLAAASRLQAQGTFVKSNSFNSLNVKSKVDLVDDVIPQKQRSTRESASSDRKEGISRSISKSISFKTPNSARPNIGESKVKMLSSKFSQLQDTKGPKHIKERNIFERKNSLQLERSSVAKTNVVSSGEANNLNSPRKFRDAKALYSDRRSTLLSKSSSFATRRDSEPSVSLSDVKRQSATSLIGISSTNGDNSIPRANKDSLKVDNSSSFRFAERSSCIGNEGLLDGLSQQNESTDFGERAKDGLSSRLREGADSKDKLKAAIEAAILRKPGIYKKLRRADRCNEVSGPPRIRSETAASHILLSESNIKENVSLSVEMEEKIIVGSSTSDFCKRETPEDAKSILIFTCEASSSNAEESPPFGQLEGMSLAIPDNEYLWKGAFEVQKAGRTISLFDGIQAHISASASPKVLEAVNKFNPKVLLKEVPRLKTWPVQFQENGVKEDNIAIFFFAKDSVSYEKSYKGLLNNMMKNDVALIGNFDGFELMIFPSNLLPEKSQCWNTMFFMWGVFRGRRVNQRLVPGSDEQINGPQGITRASMFSPSSPVNISLDIPVNSEPRVLGSASLSSSEALKAESDCRVSLDIIDDGPLQPEQVLSDNRQNLKSFSLLHSIAKSCGEKADFSSDSRCTSIFLEEKCCVGSDDKKVPEIEICVESNVIGCDLNESQENPINYHPDLNRQHLSSATGSQKISSTGDGSSVDEMKGQIHEASPNGELMDRAPPGIGNQMMDDRYAEVVSEAASYRELGTATEDIDLEEVRRTKKQKTDCYGGVYGANGGQTSSSKDSALQSDCRQLANGDDEIGSGRYFFPVLPEEEVGQVRRLMRSSSNMIDLEEDINPNLELALGAESKTIPVLPFLVEKDDKNFSCHLPSTAEPTARSKGGRGEEEDNDIVSASLSLSLSFPFPDKEEGTRTKEPCSGSEAGGQMNTSLVLFGVDEKAENGLPSSVRYAGGNSAGSGGGGFDRYV